MLEALLKLGSDCDLITPTIAFFQTKRNGPSVKFYVPYDTGWSAVQIEQMLKSKGIYVWGLMVQDEEIVFTVRETQARYTAYWLDRYRLQNESSLKEEEAGEDRAAAGGKKGRAKGTTGMLDGMLDGIDGLVDGLNSGWSQEPTRGRNR